MKKKMGALAIACVCSTGFLLGQPAFAAEHAAPVFSQNGKQEENEVVKSDYIQFTGKIANVEMKERDVVLEIQGEEKDNKMFFPITDGAFLFDGDSTKQMTKESLKKGQEVIAYVHKDKPTILIYPPVISPDILIVKNDSNGMRVEVAKFNEKLLSEEKQLKLNIGPDTEIVDEHGAKLEEKDMYDKESLVFFSASTKSIPEQTTPVKIVVLKKSENETPEINDKAQAIIDKDHYLKNGEKMIPIRDVANALGYKVKWEEASKQVTLIKENSSIILTIGEQDYGYNRSLQRLQNTPELYKEKTYVPEEIMDILYQQ